ncbi:MAG: peptidoglycan-binding domain-containing protein [Pseudomonadota bacterium]
MHAYQPERFNQYQQESSAFGPIMHSIVEHRFLALGALVSTVLMVVVIANAVWYQEGAHPAPLFATRTVDGVRPLASEPDPVVAKTKQNSTQVAALAADTSADLLREVQGALAARGYYKGKVDGIFGNRTKRAITGFQRDHSMAQTGKPSVRLLTQILMSASANPQEVPVPKPSEIVSVPVNKVKTVSLTTKSKEEAANGLIARIQSGLRAYGYENLAVDGKMGQQTATAIQRFQLDYGMKITGEPSQNVLKKLEAIGAYRQG